MSRPHDLATGSSFAHGDGLCRQRFDLRHACWMARAAELVYLPAQEVAAKLVAEWGVDEIEFLDVNDTQAVVGACDQFVIVSFRGTEPTSLQDWITDASTDLVAGPLDGAVHAGFYDALAHIWQSLDRFVRHLVLETERPVYVAGHSLGGALASLAVARWIEAELPIHALYTFGQPRCGDNAFARNFNFAFKPYAFRFVNSNDLVTRIPPRAFGYSHLGSFKYFREDGEFTEQFSWWQRFLDGWRGRIEDVFASLDDGVRDHRMSEYVRRIERACETVVAVPYRPPEIDRFLGSFLPNQAVQKPVIFRAA